MLLSGGVAGVLAKCLDSWTAGLLGPCQSRRRLSGSDCELLSEHGKRAVFPRFTSPGTRPPYRRPPRAPGAASARCSERQQK
jgi:hypothetical protein